jgi:hypothetical protein
MSNTLTEGTYQKGTSLTSKNGTFNLVFQSDGNLVLRCRNDANTGFTPFWQAGTGSGEMRNPGFQMLLTDGALEIFSAVNSPPAAPGMSGGPAIWGKGGNPSTPKSTLVVQDDGNVVIYTPAMQPLWQSGTSAMEAPGANVPNADRKLEP